MSLKVGNISNMIIGIIMAVIFVVVGIALGPTVIYYFGFINSTAMENVTLNVVIVLFANYAPLFYYLALIGGAIVMLIAAVKSA